MSQRKPLTNKEIKSQPNPQLRLLHRSMDNIPQGMYITDTQGKILIANKAFLKLIRAPIQQVVGKTVFDLYPQKVADVLADEDRKVLRTGKAIIEKVQKFKNENGMVRCFSFTTIPRFSIRGEREGLITVFRDVTPQKKIELFHKKNFTPERDLKLLAHNRNIRADFIAAVSHELRTPLAIIKQLIAILYDEIVGPLTNQQREILVKTKHNIERLKNLIEELLDVSKIESKRFHLRYSLVNLSALIRDSESLFVELAAQKKIDLTYTLPKKEINVLIDGEKIVQVLSNLLNNAIKFTPNGGAIRVDVKILDSKIQVSVIDNGIGINQKNLKKVFLEFIQVSDINDVKKEGLGLGLAIAKEIVKRHGGEIWAESKKGEGSKFYFTLPRYYTIGMIGKDIRNKINDHLKKSRRVTLINLLIIDFEGFQERTNLKLSKLFLKLQDLIAQTIRKFPWAQNKMDIMTVTDPGGKIHVIFPQLPPRKISAFLESLRILIKDYFVKKNINNIFVAVSIIYYSTKKGKAASAETPPNLNIDEIYIGSEMRRWKRINYKTNLQITSPETWKGFYMTTDLSMGGVCLVSPRLFEMDQPVTVQIGLLKVEQIIEVQGRIAWLRKSKEAPQAGGLYKAGICFSSMCVESKKLLENELKLYYE